MFQFCMVSQAQAILMLAHIGFQRARRQCETRIPEQFVSIVGHTVRTKSRSSGFPESWRVTRYPATCFDWPCAEDWAPGLIAGVPHMRATSFLARPGASAEANIDLLAGSYVGLMFLGGFQVFAFPLICRRSILCCCYALVGALFTQQATIPYAQADRNRTRKRTNLLQTYPRTSSMR